MATLLLLRARHPRLPMQSKRCLQSVTFHTEVLRAEWQSDKGKWKVFLRQTVPGPLEPAREFQDECDVLFYATGILNHFKWPKLPGISKFKGRIMHTALWPAAYQKKQWKGERVAVIGSGSSSIQTVPTMQPHVGHMDLLIRRGRGFSGCEQLWAI